MLGWMAGKDVRLAGLDLDEYMGGDERLGKAQAELASTQAELASAREQLATVQSEYGARSKSRYR